MKALNSIPYGTCIQKRQIQAVDAVPDVKAPTHSKNTCLQLCRMAFPEPRKILFPAAWLVGPSLLLLRVPSVTLVLAVLPRERLQFGAPTSHNCETCSPYTHSRYASVHILLPVHVNVHTPVHVNVPVHRLRWRSCSVVPNIAPPKALSNLRV